MPGSSLPVDAFVDNVSRQRRPNDHASGRYINEQRHPDIDPGIFPLRLPGIVLDHDENQRLQNTQRPLPTLNGHDLMSLFPPSAPDLDRDLCDTVFRRQMLDYLHGPGAQAAVRTARQDLHPRDLPVSPTSAGGTTASHHSSHAARGRRRDREHSRAEENGEGDARPGVLYAAQAIHHRASSGAHEHPLAHAQAPRAQAQAQQAAVASRTAAAHALQTPQGHVYASSHSSSPSPTVATPPHTTRDAPPKLEGRARTESISTSAQHLNIRGTRVAPVAAGEAFPHSHHHQPNQQQRPPATTTVVTTTPTTATAPRPSPPRITLIQCNPQNTHPHNPPLTKAPIVRREHHYAPAPSAPLALATPTASAPVTDAAVTSQISPVWTQQQQPQSSTGVSSASSENERDGSGSNKDGEGDGSEPQKGGGYIPRLRAPKKTCGREDCTIPYCRSVHHRKKPGQVSTAAAGQGTRGRSKRQSWTIDLTGEVDDD